MPEPEGAWIRAARRPGGEALDVVRTALARRSCGVLRSSPCGSRPRTAPGRRVVEVALREEFLMAGGNGDVRRAGGDECGLLGHVGRWRQRSAAILVRWWSCSRRSCPVGRLAQWATCFRGCAQMLGWSRSWREEPRTAGCPPERRPQGYCCSASLLRRRLSPRFGSPQSAGGARPHRKRRMSPSMCCTRTRPTWRSATGLHVTRGALTHAKIRWSANTHRRSNSAAGTAGSFAGCGACWSAARRESEPRMFGSL